MKHDPSCGIFMAKGEKHQSANLLRIKHQPNGPASASAEKLHNTSFALPLCLMRWEGGRIIPAEKCKLTGDNQFHKKH